MKVIASLSSSGSATANRRPPVPSEMRCMLSRLASVVPLGSILAGTETNPMV